jgi:hypothetical protein
LILGLAVVTNSFLKYSVYILSIFLLLCSLPFAIISLVSNPSFLQVKLSELLLAISLIFMALQAVLLRKSIQKQSVKSLYDRWLEISKIEINDPQFHKMLLSKDVAHKLKALDLPDGEFKLRAYAVLIFDTFAWEYFHGNPAGDATTPYIQFVLSNPVYRKCWYEYHVRDTWVGSPFQSFVDNILRGTERNAR